MRELLKVNVTNLKKVANGKLELEDLDLQIKKHIPYARQMVIAESIANSSADEDGFAINPHNKRLLTHIYVALEMSAYDGATLTKDLTPEKVIETYDLLNESGLLEKIASESEFGYINFVSMIEEVCNSVVNTEELTNALLQIFATGDKIEDVMGDVNKMLEDTNKSPLTIIKNESDDNGKGEVGSTTE